MDDKNFYKLLYDFPLLFPGGEESQIYCPDGWFPLVYNLCERITHHLNHPSFDEQPLITFVEQIKEKFAHLRFYIEGGDDAIHAMIVEAEDKSGSICEFTGEPACLHEKNGWMKTLSAAKAEELGYRKVQTNGTETPWISLVMSSRD